ncbi:hypothetical protein EJ06DRAFT_430163 [Trichodelitschia bisporula]|uniref:Uncharacterized protein n=1 Tax=Trichodelitschia bisporula TaxID=703511 RepID=A0A6G1HX87_9PEZI|nr:hypothetical protein EJ06DRAFT_430163 [Trichodelitschia bisporula]
MSSSLRRTFDRLPCMLEVWLRGVLCEDVDEGRMFEDCIIEAVLLDDWVVGDGTRLVGVPDDVGESEDEDDIPEDELEPTLVDDVTEVVELLVEAVDNDGLVEDADDVDDREDAVDDANEEVATDKLTLDVCEELEGLEIVWLLEAEEDVDDAVELDAVEVELEDCPMVLED